MTGGATAGSGRSFRLDPDHLPARGTIEGNGTFSLDRDRAVVRRPCGSETDTVIVRIDDYAGVAVSLAGLDDPAQLQIALTHADKSLDLPLARDDRADLLASDWQSWGRNLDLPLLVVMPDGSISAYRGDAPETLSPDAVSPGPKPRRRYASLAGRRPRFLKRRKTGLDFGTERIVAREIIART